MERRALVRRGGRIRPSRAVAALMLAMLVVQLAAQWCAWHCGVAGPADGAPFAAAPGAAPAPAPGDAAAHDPVPDGHAACGAIDWCELGQTPPLASALAQRGGVAAFAPAPAPPGPVPSFLRIPEERPPTA